MEILLERSALKTIIDVAVRNTMTVMEDRVISALQSGMDRNRLNQMATAALIAVGTAAGDQVSRGAVYKRVVNGTVQIIKQPDIMSTIAAGFTKSDKSLSLIANSVAKSIMKEASRGTLLEGGTKDGSISALTAVTRPVGLEIVQGYRKVKTGSPITEEPEKAIVGIIYRFGLAQFMGRSRRVEIVG